MQLITAKVWSPAGEMVRVNIEDVERYCAAPPYGLGYSKADPKGGTFTREKPIEVKLEAAAAPAAKPERKF